MKLNDVKKPLAITMWDSSWLRRRYAGGGFESFDTALDELVERGYNEELCDVISKNLNTDFTAARMIGYLCRYSHTANTTYCLPQIIIRHTR